MYRQLDDPLHVILVGLSDDLATDLQKRLADLRHQVQSVASEAGIADTVSAPASDTPILVCRPSVQTVSELRNAHPDTPIVVVSRDPAMSEWLDSIEAGATDYCAAPFEPAQLQWILESSLRQSMAA